MGKLGIPALKSVKDFSIWFKNSVSLIKSIRIAVLSAAPSRKSIHLIDELSNVASQAADVSQVIFDLFPSESWKEQARSNMDHMHYVFHSLNSDDRFYHKLIALDTDSLRETEKVYVQSMVRELEKEGTHVGVNNPYLLHMNKLQNLFISNVEQTSTNIEITQNKKYSFSKNQLKNVLTFNADAGFRQKAFEQLTNLAPENSEILKQLVEHRHAAAGVLGFKSYSEYILRYQMFPVTPETLIETLQECHEYLKPKLDNEYALLLDNKALAEQEDRFNPVSFYPWDTAYYVNQYLINLRTKTCPFYNKYYADENFFTLFNVLQGFTNLCFILFEIQLEIVKPENETAWSNDLFQLNLKKKGETLGVLYLDLFVRKGKYTATPCKYNVLCPKIDPYTKEYQLPISVLSCSFHKPVGVQTFADLKTIGINYDQLQTLYHELGHAMHSLVGRSEFQAFSGTRVPLDFAEIPSHLFEHFLSDYAFLSSWAKHRDTDEVYPYELFQYISLSKSSFKGLNHHMQLCMALYDLQLHSSIEIEIDSRELINEWPLSFSHLGEYGSSYYSYILDNALSESIWNLVFRKKISKEPGLLLSKALLEQGGNQHGLTQLNNLLGPSFLPTETQTTIDPFEVLLHYYNNTFKSTELIDMDDHRASH